VSVRGFSEKTRNDYIRNVRAFAASVGRSPDTATAEDLRVGNAGTDADEGRLLDAELGRDLVGG
jgi:hypothetical protein